MKIQKQFIEFLKREGVFEKYVLNFINAPKDEATRPIKHRGCYFLDAFAWDETIEGYVFWWCYNEMWQKHIKALEKKNPANYKTRCGYCGRFVKKDFWVIKGDPCVAICLKCIDKIPVEW